MEKTWIYHWTIRGVETHWLSDKENVLGAEVSKKKDGCMLTVFWNIKK